MEAEIIHLCENETTWTEGSGGFIHFSWSIVCSCFYLDRKKVNSS